MSVYIAERHLPGITIAELAAMQNVMNEGCRRFAAAGKPVRYLRSVFVPSESHCLSLFEAESAALVRDVNEAAQIPFSRIVEAIDFTP